MNPNIKFSRYNYCMISKSDLFIKLLFGTIGIISTAITIIGGFTQINNSYQFLLPISYTIAYLLLAPSINKLGLGYIVLNIIWIIRYCLLPILNVITDYSMYQVNEEYLLIALFLMFIELWVTFFAVKYYYDKFKNRFSSSKNQSFNQKKIKIRNIKLRIIFLFLGVSFFIIFIDSKALSGFNFILNQDFARRSSADFGTSALILNWTKYLITVALMGYFGKKFENNQSAFNVIMAICIMFISISIFQGTSRYGILVEALAYLFVLIRLFPRYSRKISAISIGAIFFVMLSITMYRYHDTRVLSDALNIYNVNNFTSMLNAYFSGQYNVAIGVKALDLFWDQYSVQTMLKDILANTVFLNRFVAEINGTVYYFNYAFYGHTIWADQISPTITQSIGLLNIFGIFIPIIIVYIIIKMDMLAKSEVDLLGIFITTLFAANLAFYSPGNLTIISTTITNTLLPLYLIYKISLRTNIMVIRK